MQTSYENWLSLEKCGGKAGLSVPSPLGGHRPWTILVLSSGSSTEHLPDMGHRRIRWPMYPLDDDFEMI
jgi:hypothetical protein